jgi:protocatechuate 3,4-dioxygenase beta subunit
MKMSEEKNSRRRFLQWIGASSGAMVLTGLGCGGAQSVDVDSGRADDAGTQDVSGRTDGGRDAGPGAPDAADTADAPDAADTADTASPSDTADAENIACEPTGSDVEGPFHVDGAPQRTVLAEADEPGDRLVVEGTVYGPDCTTPVAGAMLDVWHADAEGNYHEADQDYRLRGQMMTDADGRYRLETIRPGNYPLGNSMRPAHIHFTITKPGYAPLTTQLYFAGDPFLSPNDPCGGGCNSGDPTLIIDLDEPAGQVDWRGTFDIVLETS